MPKQYYWITDNSSNPTVSRPDMERCIWTYLMVSIIEYSFDDNPEFALCKFMDVSGKIHYIREKIPIVSSEDIWFNNKNTVLPQFGYVAGEIINNENGIIYFSTENPWCIETDEKLNKFYVYDNQIINKTECDLIHKIKSAIDSGNGEIYKAIMNFKNKKGTQRKAYDIISKLYQLYREQNIEEKEDMVANILDVIVGFTSKHNWIWEEYPEFKKQAQRRPDKAF